MGENTPNLNLKFIMQNQSQKEVTVNEALLVLDMLHNNGVIKIGETTPPASPNDSDMYVVGSGATGDWSGQDGNIGYYYTGKGWQFITPKEGMTLWCSDEDRLYVFNSRKWVTANSNPNIIINGDGIIAQRNTSFSAVSDDTYTLDRWLVLSDGDGVIDLAQELSDIPDGSRSAIKGTVVTANKKFALVQIIENKNCKHLDKVSLSFKVKGDISNIRAGILKWSGTADSLTSDAISTWEAVGTDPTLITNWSYANYPFDISVAGSYSKVDIEDVSVVGAGNIAVFIWADCTTTIGDELYITGVKLEEGYGSTDYQIREIGDELALCQRYYQKSYNQDTFAGASTLNGAEEFYISGLSSADYDIKHTVNLPVSMRTNPAVITYGDSGTIGQVCLSSGNVVPTVTARENKIIVAGTNGAVATDRKIAFQFTADAEM